MTAPNTGWPLLLWALLLGAALGVYYGFLRPLRPRHTTLSDLLFVIPALWVWVYHSFALCRGDIRPGNCVVMALGGILTDKTIGRFLRPVFFGFWHYVGVVTAFLTTPVKNFSKKRQNQQNFSWQAQKKRVQ